MIRPFRFDDLFQINPDAVVAIENDCLIIDNFFLDYDEILDYVYNVSVEIWKHAPNGRNFVDYYDCRHAIQNDWNHENRFDNKIISLIKYYYGMDVAPVFSKVEFNYFKHIKSEIGSNYQHAPHKDFNFNLIVYLDTQANGGTAIYKIDKDIKDNSEFEYLMYDVSGLEKTIIKAKPNRCVIFNGMQYHGGHIDDHEVYYRNWRINLVRFYECILS